jgi:hypothetical protein
VFNKDGFKRTVNLAVLYVCMHDGCRMYAT